MGWAEMFPDYHYPPETSADWKAHWRCALSTLLLMLTGGVAGFLVGLGIGQVL